MYQDLSVNSLPSHFHILSHNYQQSEEKISSKKNAEYRRIFDSRIATGVTAHYPIFCNNGKMQLLLIQINA